MVIPWGGLFVLPGNRFGVQMGAVQGTNCRVVIVAAEKIIGLRPHDHFDRGFVSDIVFFGDQRAHFIEMLFVGH